MGGMRRALSPVQVPAVLAEVVVRVVFALVVLTEHVIFASVLKQSDGKT